VKIALAIVCSLFLVLGQALALSVPTASVSVAKHDCGCGGKMSCCQKNPASQPLTAIASAGSENQVVSSVPVMVIWVLAATGTAQISPTVSPSLIARSAPIFARNCVWLI